MKNRSDFRQKSIAQYYYRLTIVIFSLAFLILKSNEVYCQSDKNADTIYIKAYLKDLDTKFNFIHATPIVKSGTVFCFNIKWGIYGDPQNQLIFSSMSSPVTPANAWFSTIVDDKKIAGFKTVYTLKQLAEKLNKTSLKDKLYSTRFILLYGANKSKKYELYPVNIEDGTWDPPHIFTPKSNN